MQSKNLNILIFSYIFLVLLMAFVTFFDFYGVYSEDWESKFRNLALESGNGYPEEINSVWGAFFISYVIFWISSLLGMYKRKTWAAHLFCSCIALSWFSMFIYPETVDYSDKLVSGLDYATSVLEGGICAIVIMMRRDAGFPS